jgi:hypothetical protein
MELQSAYIEEVKLLARSANRVGKEQGIPLGPADLRGGILETNTGTRHFDDLFGSRDVCG